MTGTDLHLYHDVCAFLAHEADLLDSAAFDAWLNLFEEDGIYWVPSSRDQTDMKTQVSVILEDKPLLRLRIARLTHPHAYAIEPYPATTHLIGNVAVRSQGDTIEARSKLIVDELRDDKPNRLSGTVLHRLRRRGEGFGIALKRVDVIQAGHTFSAISIPL